MLLGNRVAESLCRIRQPYHVYLSIDGGNGQANDSNRGKDSFRRAVRGGHCLLRHRGESAWPHVSLYQLDLGVDEATYDAEFLNLAAQCDVWQRVTPIVANGSDPTYNDSLDPTLHWQADARGPQPNGACFWAGYRSEEHTSELQSLMRISYAVFCLKKKTKQHQKISYTNTHKNK